jgi:hypothetical protein
MDVSNIKSDEYIAKLKASLYNTTRG